MVDDEMRRAAGDVPEGKPVICVIPLTCKTLEKTFH